MNPIAKLRIKHNPKAKYLYVIKCGRNQFWVYELISDKDVQLFSDICEAQHPEFKVVSRFVNCV